MPDSKYLSVKNLFAVFKHLVRWTVIILPVAFVIGSLVALFLWLLSLVIHFRFAHPWLLYLLPLAGIAIYFVYKLYGKNSEKGNDLIIDEIHETGGGVPKRMTPLVLLATVITHLFGGSAGREGTAVQWAAALRKYLVIGLN
jgi:H+/Cl- antiporter ClcA